MKIESFEFRNRKNVYVFVEEGRGLAAVPATIRARDGGLAPYKKFNLAADSKPPIAMDVRAALADIGKQGYHIQGTAIGYTETVI